MFKFVKYARLRSLTTPESVGDAEKNITANSDTDNAPLLQGHVEGGGETIQGTTCPSVALFLSLGSLVLSVLFYAVAHHRVVTDLSCQRRMWAYSPEANYLQYETRQYDSDLIPNELFGLPTQERRDAWDWLWKTARFSFPYEKLPSINKSTETREWWALPYPRDNEVIAMSEVMHQVHCVGVLWLFAHRDDWDYRTVLNKTEVFMKIHQRHCGVVLLQMVKCMADVTPVLFQHDENGRLGAWRPRDAPRRCKRFDRIAQWERDNAICPMACTPEVVARLYPGTPSGTVGG